MHILTLSHILAKVVYTPEFWNQNFLKFFTTKLQPHSLKVSKKKKSFSMQPWLQTPFHQNQSKKHLYKPYKAIMYRWGSANIG